MLASRQTVGYVVLVAVDAVAVGVVFFITSVVNTLVLKINDFVFHTVAFNYVLTLVGVGNLIVFIVDVVLNMVAYVATVALSVVDDDVIFDVVLTVVVDVVLTVVGVTVFLDKEDAIGFVATADGESLGVGCCCKCRCSCRCS